MELDQIKVFIDAMASSDLTELQANKDGWVLRLVRRTAPAQSQATVSGLAVPSSARSKQREPAVSLIAGQPGSEVRAPLFGLVHLTPSPDAPPFVAAAKAALAQDWSRLDPPALVREFETWTQKTLVEFARESLKPTVFADFAWNSLAEMLKPALGEEGARPAMTARIGRQRSASINSLTPSVWIRSAVVVAVTSAAA
jgi:hypothetical protein